MKNFMKGLLAASAIPLIFLAGCSSAPKKARRLQVLMESGFLSLRKASVLTATLRQKLFLTFITHGWPPPTTCAVCVIMKCFWKKMASAALFQALSWCAPRAIGKNAGARSIWCPTASCGPIKFQRCAYSNIWWQPIF